MADRIDKAQKSIKSIPEQTVVKGYPVTRFFRGGSAIVYIQTGTGKITSLSVTTHDDFPPELTPLVEKLAYDAEKLADAVDALTGDIS